MNIAGTDYKALNTLDAAKRWGVSRQYLHKCQKAGEPLLSQRQYGGKQEVLWSLYHLDAWAISKGLELQA